MFQMRSGSHQCDLHIGYRSPDDYSGVLSLVQMRQYKSLPISVQHILADGTAQHKTAPFRKRLHQKMYFGVVFQRLEMSYTQRRFCYSFLV